MPGSAAAAVSVRAARTGVGTTEQHRRQAVDERGLCLGARRPDDHDCRLSPCAVSWAHFEEQTNRRVNGMFDNFEPAIQRELAVGALRREIVGLIIRLASDCLAGPRRHLMAQARTRVVQADCHPITVQLGTVRHTIHPREATDAS